MQAAIDLLNAPNPVGNGESPQGLEFVVSGSLACRARPMPSHERGRLVEKEEFCVLPRGSSQRAFDSREHCTYAIAAYVITAYTLPPMGAKKSMDLRRTHLQQILREMRVTAGLNQVDLAARLGTDQSFVSRFERGERRLDLVELADICASCETSLRALVSRFEIKKSGTAESVTQPDKTSPSAHK
jgi:DNA-binding transcriptional regulator YiaG